ncbi:nuclear pore complex protein Nup58 [Drosophila tropicalis]|uniref:nuclear pore complex protein Nup58 n=1 Tax=Drosophila tropicalis TaxID=46794 RepID=UPI0035ABE9EE
MSFSFTPTTNAGLTAAAPGAATAAFGFGARTAAATAPVNAPPAFGANSFGLGGGSAAPVSAVPTLAFGAQAAAATAAPTFGAAPAATIAPTFGVPTTAAPAFGAPVGAVAPTFSFGTAAATSAPTTAPPAFGLTSAAPTATGSLGMPATLGTSLGTFGFNKPAVSQPAAGASLNFNTTTTTATAQPFNTGLRLGTTNPTGIGGLGVGIGGGGGIFGSKPAQPAAAPSTFVGLGGIDVSATQPKLGDNKQDGIKIKETQVPDEIVKTVDALKTFIKQQKTISSDIGRTSTSKFTNVSHEIMNLKWALQNMANSVDANNQQIKLLRHETAKAIQSLEMAQRTQDTPAGLQFENSAPFQYFQCLVAKYEQDLISFRQEINLTERHMNALTNPQSISPEDLKRGFRQLNESFISLAGRLHEVHQRVEEQKEHYLNLRRYRLRDATNVFEKIENPPPQPHQLVEPQSITTGPTPFSNISATSTLNKSYAAMVDASSSNAAPK